jgi:Sortase domain
VARIRACDRGERSRVHRSGAEMPARRSLRRPAMAAWTKSRLTAIITGVVLIAAGGSVLGLAAAAQQRAPQPGPAQAGSSGPVVSSSGGSREQAVSGACSSSYCGALPAPPTARGSGSAAAQAPALARSLPVSVAIPAIGVDSRLLYVGLNPDGTIAVPPLNHPPLTDEAAWYKYSPTPGQLGPSIIEGHVDSLSGGPSVFFRLGALKPGDLVSITLADRRVAVFKITGVRLYLKSRFPTSTVYGSTGYAALRLITCGGSFDERSHHYSSNIVAFASLVSSHPA